MSFLASLVRKPLWLSGGLLGAWISGVGRTSAGHGVAGRYLLGRRPSGVHSKSKNDSNKINSDSYSESERQILERYLDAKSRYTTATPGGISLVPPPPNPLPHDVVLLRLAMKLASLVAWFKDNCNNIWFIWKTGQLSYEYSKKYALLDERYKITSKVDAWNNRFKEGKQNFDKWERENEVGRKVVAGVTQMGLIVSDVVGKDRSERKGKAEGGSREFVRREGDITITINLEETTARLSAGLLLLLAVRAIKMVPYAGRLSFLLGICFPGRVRVIADVLMKSRGERRKGSDYLAVGSGPFFSRLFGRQRTKEIWGGSYRPKK